MLEVRIVRLIEFKGALKPQGIKPTVLIQEERLFDMVWPNLPHQARYHMANNMKCQRGFVSNFCVTVCVEKVYININTVSKSKWCKAGRKSLVFDNLITSWSVREGDSNAYFKVAIAFTNRGLK